MKQALINTVIGHHLLNLRANVQLLHALLFKTEILGTLANDRIGSRLLIRLCRTGHYFVDVGAHIGSIVSEVLYHDREVNIIAIEAMPDKANKLKKKFPGIIVHQCAAGTNNCQVPFYIDKNASACSSLIAPRSSHSDKLEIQVSMRPLDDIIPSVKVDVIKIDVEGAELQVIQGAIGTIGTNRPALYFESGSKHDPGYLEQLWELLSDSGYVILVPNRLAHDDEIGLSKSGFLESHGYPRQCTNYFAIPSEKRRNFRDRARLILDIRAG